MVGEGGVVFFEFGLRGVVCWLAGRFWRFRNLDRGLAEPSDDLEIRRGGVQGREGFFAVGNRGVAKAHRGGAHEDAFGGVGGFGQNG